MNEIAFRDLAAADIQGNPTLPPVAIIVPALNEARYIAACLASLIAQRDCTTLEIIVADGGSTDRTVEIVTEMSRNHPQIRLVHNFARIQSAGFNLAAQVADARAEVLVRCDAHTSYPDDFVVECVRALVLQGATSIVVPMRTVGLNGFQLAVAAAQNSRLGNGGSAHRSKPRSGYVDHGHHAAFSRAFFMSLGGYNETFSHNEDAEFDIRATQAGGRIWMCGSAVVDYHPRSAPGPLARQYYKFGRGRARTIVTHRVPPALRQLAPVLLLPGLLLSLLLTALSPVFLLIPFAYFGGSLLLGAIMAVQQRKLWLLATGPAANIMHLAFAFGFLRLIVERRSELALHV